MAIENNAPTRGCIYIKDMQILYDGVIYTINNIYTRDKYIYWQFKTSDLITSNNMLNEENLILIIKNVDGVSFIYPTELIELLFDGYSNKTISQKIKEVNENNKEYKKQLEITQGNIDNLSEEYKQNLSFDEMKELINTSIINSNSLLIDLKTMLINYLNDNEFTSAEKSDVNYRLNSINNKFIEMLAYGDALLDLLATSDSNIDSTTMVESKLTLEKLLSDLITELKIVTEDEESKVTLEDISIIISDITTLLINLSSFKDTCDNTLNVATDGSKILGSGGTISNQVYNTNQRIDTIVNNMNDLQVSLVNSFAKEKQQIQDYFNLSLNLSNKMVNMTNALNTSDGRITETQFKKLDINANDMINCLSKIEASYMSYYNNSKLSDESKNLLKQFFDDFKIKHTNYTNSVKVDMRDRIFSKDERQAFTVRLTEYRESRNKLNAQLMTCINEINSATNDLNFQQIESRLNEKIVDIQNQINTINNQINEIKTDITEIKNRLTNIESRLDSLENTTP